jgi:hypothetical protein
VLVDLEAFATPAGCEMCGNCCSWGATVPADAARKLSPHVAEIAERYLPAHRRAGAGWNFSRAWDTDFTNIVKIGPGRKACGFLYERDGRYLCSIHSWSLDTGRDPLDYLPFECFMFPVAILDYDGLLHPGKQLLTVRTGRNSRIVDVYGPGRAVRRSLLRRLLLEIRTSIRNRFSAFRRGRDPEEECYFRNVPGVRKEPSYLYFGRAVTWYYGKEFHGKLADAVLAHTGGAGSARPAGPAAPSGDAAG